MLNESGRTKSDYLDGKYDSLLLHDINFFRLWNLVCFIFKQHARLTINEKFSGLINLPQPSSLLDAIYPLIREA